MGWLVCRRNTLPRGYVTMAKYGSMGMPSSLPPMVVPTQVDVGNWPYDFRSHGSPSSAPQCVEWHICSTKKLCLTPALFRFCLSPSFSAAIVVLVVFNFFPLTVFLPQFPLLFHLPTLTSISPLLVPRCSSATHSLLSRCRPFMIPALQCISPGGIRLHRPL